MDIQLIGIDCAVQPRNVGLAAGRIGTNGLVLEDVAAGGAGLEDWIVSRIRGPSVIALDAPLGWPRALAPALAEHAAGQPLGVVANRLFRRSTDDEIHQRLRKRPLDVGAALIARTAHEALALLGRLRAAASLEIPLGWQPDVIDGAVAIEVYPAATLSSRGWSLAGYKAKGTDGQERRSGLVERLAAEISIEPALQARLATSEHVFDAAIAVLAAADFARGDVVAPTDSPRARREGWIWCAPRRDA